MGRNAMLVLVRHGQSEWNKENRFTGWVDVDLSQEGIEECRKTAGSLRGIPFEVGFTSLLRRAWRSLEIIARELALDDIPLIRTEALNERHYGDLQGMNKDEARRQFGEEQVHRWRRGFHERPPNGESLADVSLRVIPFYESFIKRFLVHRRSVLVVAHGNSLRALVKHIECIRDDDIMRFEIATGEIVRYICEVRRNPRTMREDILVKRAAE